MLWERKFLIHGCVMIFLIIYTMVAWNSSEKESEEARAAAEEAFMNSDIDPYAEAKLAESDDGGAAMMFKVGAPLLITIIYGGILSAVYLLPLLVDKMGEEVMGSGAEVDRDPLQEARAALAAGDYVEAVGRYRKIWLEKRGERLPVVEMARIQRDHLKTPVAAVSTLQEALDDHEWPEDDAAFLLFRLVDIYESDLDDDENLVITLRRVIEKLEGTRHSANAAHKLRELGYG